MKCIIVWLCKVAIDRAYYSSMPAVCKGIIRYWGGCRWRFFKLFYRKWSPRLDGFVVSPLYDKLYFLSYQLKEGGRKAGLRMTSHVPQHEIPLSACTVYECHANLLIFYYVTSSPQTAQTSPPIAHIYLYCEVEIHYIYCYIKRQRSINTAQWMPL